jgi:hypothetical protein
MSKNASVEARLKEAEIAKVALEAEVTKLAGENDTYTSRMKEMEDNISKAMSRMAEMETKMEEYAKMKATLDEKMTQTSATLQEMVDSEDEEGEDSEKMAGNVIEGVNEKVVAGQKKGKKAKSAELPEFIKEKIEDAKDDEEDKPSEKAKNKAKKAEEAVAEPVAEAVAVEKVAEVAPVAEAKVEEIAKVAEQVAPTPVAKDIVKDVVEALINEKVGEVTSKFAMAQSKFNELDAELVKAKETLALEAKVKEAAMATISGLSAKYEALLAKVSGIESNSKTVEEKVAKTVANLGVEPIAADMQSENIVKEKSATEIVSEFESIADAKEKRAFYKKHAQTIIDATFPKKR